MVCHAGVSAAGARAWLPLLRGRTTWWGWAAGVAVTLVPFALWFGIWWQIRSVPWLVGRIYSLGVDDPARFGVDVWRGPAIELMTLMYPPLTLLSAQPLVVPALAVVSLYPLSARLRRRARDGGLRAALRIALAAAATFGVVLLGARAALRGFTPEVAGAANFSSYFYFCTIAAVTVLQAVTGGLVAARGRPSGLILGQFAALVVAVVSTGIVLLGQAIGGCVPAFRLNWSTCSFPNGLSYAWDLLEKLVPQGALAALVGGVAVAVIRRLPRVGSAWVTPVAAVLLLVVSVTVAGRAIYATDSPAAGPAPQGPSAAPVRGGPNRPLTAAEARLVAQAVGAGLPQNWRQKPERGETGTAGDTTIEPPACRPYAAEAYLESVRGSEVAVGTVVVDNGGKLASSFLSATVRSYSLPVEASVLAAAERDRAACPRFTASDPTGFRLESVVRSAAVPALGEQSWRVASTMTSTVPVTVPATGKTTTATVTGKTTTATVRSGHTLITLTMTSVGEPLDEAVFLAALRRLAGALPA
jgi:hypothetical protein